MTNMIYEWQTDTDRYFIDIKKSQNELINEWINELTNELMHEWTNVDLDHSHTVYKSVWGWVRCLFVIEVTHNIQSFTNARGRNLAFYF